jgi:hypothetical protein
LSQTTLVRFCNLVNAKPSTPTNDCSSREAMLSLASPPDPTEAEPSCERYDTETFSLEKIPAGAPKAPAVPTEER